MDGQDSLMHLHRCIYRSNVSACADLTSTVVPSRLCTDAALERRSDIDGAPAYGVIALALCGYTEKATEAWNCVCYCTQFETEVKPHVDETTVCW